MELYIDVPWTLSDNETDVMVVVKATTWRGRLESFEIKCVRPFEGGADLRVDDDAIANDWRFIQRIREVIAEEYGYRDDEDAEHRLSARQMGISNILGTW